MADMSNIAALLARGNSGGGQQRSYLDSPMYQQMLAQTLAQGQPQSEYPGQAIANTASQLINAYMLKQGMQQAQQKQQAGNQSLADALLPGQDVPGMAASAQIPGMTSEAPPAPAMPGGIAPRPITTPGSQVDVSTSGFKVDDPSNAGLVAALNGGAIDAQSLAPALMQKFGLGAPKEPMKFSPGDVGFDPVTHQAIPGMSAPFKPDEPKAPTTRQVEVGDNIITQEWDGKKWNDIAKAPRYKPTVAPDNSSGWQVVLDPQTQKPYRYNPRTAQSTNMDGSPMAAAPAGYQKPSNYQPRSAIAIYMDSWNREHPQASAAEKATAMNTFAGQQSEQHTLGTQGAKVESANAGLDSVISQSNDAYAKLPRGSFVPFNQLAKMAQTNGWSDPSQADAFAADTGVINMWARAINPQGVLTVENTRRGEQMLSQAQSPEAHAAVLERMRKEGLAARGGIDQFRHPGVQQPSPAGGKIIHYDAQGNRVP